MPAPVLHQAVVESLGQEIVDGVLVPGQAVLLEDVVHRFGVSRSVAREALRVLETLGLVTIKRRVGTVVQPIALWRVSHPRTIRWRLAGPSRAKELDDLMQLRAGLEPMAARLAAASASARVAQRLTDLAATMLRLGRAGRGMSEDFLAADVEFHGLLLAASENRHLAAFADVLTTILIERNHLGLLGNHPDERAMLAHRDIAAAIAARDPAAAELATRALVDVVHAEVLVDRRSDAAPPVAAQPVVAAIAQVG